MTSASAGPVFDGGLELRSAGSNVETWIAGRDTRDERSSRQSSGMTEDKTPQDTGPAPDELSDEDLDDVAGGLSLRQAKAEMKQQKTGLKSALRKARKSQRKIGLSELR